MDVRGYETERTALRALEPEDATPIQAYLNDAALIGCRHLPWSLQDVAPVSRAQVAAAIEEWGKAKAGFTLGIEAKASGRLIGHAGCDWNWDPHCPSLAVVIAPSQQRAGLGSEVSRLLLEVLFLETPAHTVIGWLTSWNAPALAFAAAHGFSECGRIPRAGLRDGAYYDDIVVDLLRREWLARRGGGGRDGA
ncbi:MAG: GNAT family protein [Candidatus Bipolaricaulis sp.]|nr:GNAT family protein [Candidatus Bipolaricaulis sp.]MDD5219577.1 GNAT family protein [Candidatus Bipolaricaulis sp.]MDD5645845.1 GNAT family protein [Candidatus Bipolaricaulis sp.]